MNVLYFDQRQLWTPQINDTTDEFDIAEEEEEFHSINRNQISKGKWLSLWITPISLPSVRIPMQIAEE